MSRAAAVGLLATFIALAWAPPASATADGAMRYAIRAEVGGAAGWSGRGAVAGEARLALRLGSITGGLTVDVAGPPSRRHGFLQTQVGLGAGLVFDLGDWEADATANLVAINTRYPELLGPGSTDLLTLGVGLRFGLGRYFGGPERPGKLLVPWFGLAASFSQAQPTRIRALEARHPGFVALLSVTLGAGL